MPYIYKYVDRETDTPKYIGLIKNDKNFPKRFQQHRRDKWYKDAKWDIYYAYYPTQTDVEMLEGHLIAEYGTDEYYNIAKSEWGLCSFAPPKIPWVKWGPCEDEYNGTSAIIRSHMLEEEYWVLRQEVVALSSAQERLYDRIERNIKGMRAEELKISREFWSNYCEVIYPYKQIMGEEEINSIKKYIPYVEKGISAKDAYEMFCESDMFAQYDGYIDEEDFKALMDDRYCIERAKMDYRFKDADVSDYKTYPWVVWKNDYKSYLEKSRVLQHAMEKVKITI